MQWVDIGDIRLYERLIDVSKPHTKQKKQGRSGKVLARLPMRPRVLHHPDSLDVCLLHLEDELGALARMKEHGLELSPLELSDAVPGAGQVSVGWGGVGWDDA